MKTKKLLLGLLASLLILFFSCEGDSNQNETTTIPLKNSSLTNKVDSGEGIGFVGGDACPDGMIPVISYEFDTFRFHRPKKDCKSGFWFCSDGKWVITCVENPNGKIHSGITDSSTTVAAIIDKNNKIVSFHFPIGLIGKDGNTLSDFETFNVDEEVPFGNLTLIKGAYSSIFTTDEIIINVPAN